MNKKGFSLIEVLLGLFLLGLISVSILPVLTSTVINMNKNKIKLEMNYIGEMALEKIKSYDEENFLDDFIFNEKTLDLIELFKKQENSKITLKESLNGENYLLEISKEERSNKLWLIKVCVYHDREGSNVKDVEYKNYIIKK